MSPILKIMVGALMMVLGIFTSITYSSQLFTLVLGGIGPLLVLVGAFIVWLESDELKVQREESKQKKKEQEFERQQTLDQQEESNNREARQAAQEIKQAVSSNKGNKTGAEQLVQDSTVEEVKEAVREREDLSTREVLEAEKNNQNRKTLVNYLERRLE